MNVKPGDLARVTRATTELRIPAGTVCLVLRPSSAARQAEGYEWEIELPGQYGPFVAMDKYLRPIRPNELPIDQIRREPRYEPAD